MQNVISDYSFVGSSKNVRKLIRNNEKKITFIKKNRCIKLYRLREIGKARCDAMRCAAQFLVMFCMFCVLCNYETVPQRLSV